jgi:hypothetical protein
MCRSRKEKRKKKEKKQKQKKKKRRREAGTKRKPWCLLRVFRKEKKEIEGVKLKIKTKQKKLNSFLYTVVFSNQLQFILQLFVLHFQSPNPVGNVS